MSDQFTPIGTTRFERLVNARHELSEALERVENARKLVELAGGHVWEFEHIESDIRVLQEGLITSAAMGAK